MAKVTLLNVFYDDAPQLFVDLRDHRFSPDQPLHSLVHPKCVAQLVSGLTLSHGRVEVYFDLRPVGAEVGSAETVEPIYEHPVHGKYTWSGGPTLVR